MKIMLLFNLFLSVGITMMWIYSTPMIKLKRLLGLKQEGEYTGLREFLNEMVHCPLCSGFWIAMISIAVPLNPVLVALGLCSWTALVCGWLGDKLDKQ